MIKFIKNLLGFGSQETVQEILTPPVLITRIAVPESNITPVKEGKVRTNVKKPKANSKKPSAPPAAKPKAKPKAKTKK